jgi:hypothetical protein
MSAASGSASSGYRMSEPLLLVVENSLQIAWDFLIGSGEIQDHQRAAEILLDSIRTRALRGEHRTLMLANSAIDAYRDHRLHTLDLTCERLSECESVST